MSLGETTTGETTTTVINLTKSQSKKSACLYSSDRPKRRTGMGQDKKRADIFQNGSFLFCLILVRFLFPGEAHRAHLT